MAARIQIEVDVNSSEFEQFKSSFKQYTDALAKAPAHWSKISQAAKETSNENLKATKAISEYSEQAEKSNKFVGALRQHSEVINRMWVTISQSTRSAASHITDATRSLLQWSGVTGLIGGIAGYATVQGISNLMNTAAGGRSTAMGLGTSYAKWKSFTTNYARLGDMDSFLNRLNVNKSTVEGRSGLYALGLKDKDIAKETPDLGANVIKRLKKFVDNTPDEILGNRLRQYRLDQYISPEDALLLKRMKAGEVAQLAEGYQKDVKNKTYDVNEQDLKKWQDFKTKIDSAGNAIAKTFIEGLAPVAEKLGNFADWTSSHLDGLEHLPEMVEAKWKSFGEFIANAKWEPWVVDFFVGVRDITRALWNYLLKSVVDFARWLGVDIAPEDMSRMAPSRGGGEEDAGQGGPGSNNAGARGSPSSGTPSGQGGGGDGDPNSAHNVFERMKQMKADPQDKANNPPGFNAQVKKLRDAKRNEAAGGGKGGLKGIIDYAADEAGIPRERMYGIVAGESLHYDTYDIGDSGKSFGPFQMYKGGGLGNRFEADTGLDVADPKTLPAQAKWIAHFIKHGGSMGNWHGYHGDRNWNPNWGRMGVVGDDKAAENVKPRDPSAGRGAIGRRNYEDLLGDEGHRGGDAIMGSAQRSLRAYNEGGSTHTKVTVNHSPGNDPNTHAAAMSGNGQ